MNDENLCVICGERPIVCNMQDTCECCLEDQELEDTPTVITQQVEEKIK